MATKNMNFITMAETGVERNTPVFLYLLYLYAVNNRTITLAKPDYLLYIDTRYEEPF